MWIFIFFFINVKQYFSFKKEYFWLRQELKATKTLCLRPSSSKLSRALNITLQHSGSGLSQVIFSSFFKLSVLAARTDGALNTSSCCFIQINRIINRVPNDP